MTDKDYSKYICPKTNLFANATKELTQDGFILWVLNNYNSKNKELKDFSEFFLKKLLSAKNEIKELELKTYKQYKKIDVLVKYKFSENEPYKFLIIEDKTTSSEHDNQLIRYYTTVHDDYKALTGVTVDAEKIKENIKGVYFKTDIISDDEISRIKAANKSITWTQFDIYKIKKEIFDEFLKPGEKFKNVILQQFYEYLSAKYNRLNKLDEIFNCEEFWSNSDDTFEEKETLDIWQKFFIDFQKKHSYKKNSECFVFDIFNYQKNYWEMFLGAKKYSFRYSKKESKNAENPKTEKVCLYPVLSIKSRGGFTFDNGNATLHCGLNIHGMPDYASFDDVKDTIRKKWKDMEPFDSYCEFNEPTHPPKEKRKTLLNITITMNTNDKSNYGCMKKLCERSFTVYEKIVEKLRSEFFKGLQFSEDPKKFLETNMNCFEIDDK